LFILFFIVVLAIYIALNFYLGKKIYKFLLYLFPGVNKKIFWIVYALVSLPMVLSFVISNTSDSVIFVIFRFISNYSMGLYFYLLLFFVLIDLGLLIYKLLVKLKVIKKPLSARSIFTSSCTALVIAVILFSYSAINALTIYEITYDINIDKTSPIKNLKIALISDLHLGYIHGEGYVKKIVDIINSNEPDIVVIAGDIFDGNYYALDNPDQAAKHFSKLKSKYGTFACLGNHDSGGTIDKMIEFLEKSQIKLLNDEYVSNDDFTLIGRRDSTPIGTTTDPRELISYEDIDKNLPIIVIDHKPSAYEEYPDFVDLILSGHTHRGQMFPLNYVTALVHIKDYGYFRQTDKSPQMIVSSGVGTWGPPLRSGSNNEIVYVEIEFR